jgi:predicted CopG family antitoxin
MAKKAILPRTKVVRISQNSYDNLLFIKSQLETKAKQLKSFSDVVDYLVGLWNKKYDRGKKK